MSRPAAPFWREPHPLLLASASATRRALLEAAAIPVETIPAAIDERALEAALGDVSADSVAANLAAAKALEVSRRNPHRLVVGADQTLALAEHRFHKPGEAAEARSQLLRLRGAEHLLCSAYALARGGRLLRQGSATARMRMRMFSDAFLDAYLAQMGDDVTGTVGGYRLEGPGAQLFEQIDGDHSTILGLPLMPLLEDLRALDAVMR
jgi:septum formation protein